MQKNPAIAVGFAILTAAVFTLSGSAKAFAAEKAGHAAKIIVLQGQVFKKAKSGQETPAKKDDLLSEGTVLVTKDRSFVKLLFIDNTQMNLGPNSSMQIEKFKANEAGMVQLIDGKIRAKVQKDLLSKERAPAAQENKLLIRTKTAAMGVRGTDFQVTYNAANETTSLVTFESDVAMVRLEPGAAPVGGRATASADAIAETMARALQSSDAVMVGEGQFSAATPNAAASEPVRISPEQLEQLFRNDTFSAAPAAGETGAATNAPAYKSPVPPGLSAKAVATSPLEAVAGTIRAIAASGGANTSMSASTREVLVAVRATIQETQANTAKAADAGKGGVLGGGYVDLSRGVYVAPNPAAGATFDPTTGLFIPDPSVKVGTGGSLEVAKGVTISDTGQVTRAPEPGRPGAPAAVAATAPGAAAAGAGGNRSPASVESAAESGGSDDLNDEDESDEEEEDDDDQQQQTTQNATSTDVGISITVQ